MSLSIQYKTIQYVGYDFTPKFNILTQNDICKSPNPCEAHTIVLNKVKYMLNPIVSASIYNTLI